MLKKVRWIMQNNMTKQIVASRYFKIFVAIVIALFVAWISSSYTKNEIADRAIVLGIGVDYADEIFEVTAEVVSPNEGSEGGGVSATSKLLSGKGETVPLAIQNIYQTSGKNPSLGQTGIILLGEGTRDIEIKHVLSYFILSDAFKDGVTIAACNGSAKEIFESTSPVDSMVSFALQTIIQKSGKKTNSTSNVLQNFVEKQTTLSGVSFLSEVSFIDDENQKANKTKDSEKKTGVYDCSRVSVFKNGLYVATLDSDHTRGFVLLDKSKTYDSFVIENAESVIGTKDKVSVGIVSKDVSSDVVFDGERAEVEYDVNIKLRRMRTDVSGSVMDFLPKVPTFIDDNIKDEVKIQIEKLVLGSFEKAMELNCDYFGVANSLYKKYGNKWKDFQDRNPDYLKDVIFKIKVNIED